LKNKKSLTVGLIGNPNTGKTSLLNCLTGLCLHVGNWPGKTVERKEGAVNFNNHKINIVDLPGTYSIAPYSEEEKITRQYIVEENPDVIVQTVDVTTLGRHLLMTFELLALNKNIILAFNFNKEAEKRNIKIDYKKLEKVLEIPIVKIEAHTCKNKKALLKETIKAASEKSKIPKYLKKILKENNQISHNRSLKFIRKNISPLYKHYGKNGKTKNIDTFVLNSYTALPFFLLVMFLMFKLTFVFSKPLVALIEQLFSQFETLIFSLSLPEIIQSFLTAGVINGLGSILSFVPLIFILFFFIALLEDSGYLARTVVLTDRLFEKFGISGKVFIPMILGFGCNVPAIMATRTIKNRKERLIAIFINSFISCGARLPIYVLFTSIFFPKNTSLIIFILYLFGVLTALVISFVLAKLIGIKNNNCLIIELPPYRMPTFRNVHKQAWHQTSLFIKKAGTIILMAVVLIWFLASFPFGVEYGSELSLLGRIGKTITPFFKPLGFGNWKFSVALLFGLVAKEIIVSTLGALYGLGESGLMSVIPNQISPLGALAFLFFTLLYIPCLATIAVIKKESGNWRFTLLQIITTIAVAWIVSFLVYNIGMLFV